MNSESERYEFLVHKVILNRSCLVVPRLGSVLLAYRKLRDSKA